MTWTPSDEAFVLANHQRLTAAQIGKHLGRSAALVEMRRKRLGLTKPPKRPKADVPTTRLADDPDYHEINTWTNYFRMMAGLPAKEWV